MIVKGHLCSIFVRPSVCPKLYLRHYPACRCALFVLVWAFTKYFLRRAVLGPNMATVEVICFRLICCLSWMLVILHSLHQCDGRQTLHCPQDFQWYYCIFFFSFFFYTSASFQKTYKICTKWTQDTAPSISTSCIEQSSITVLNAHNWHTTSKCQLTAQCGAELTG